MILGAFVLLVVALGFVAAELVVPTHGILAIVALASAIGGIVLAFQANPYVGLAFTLVSVVAAPVVFYWAIKIYPSTPVGKRVLLSNPNPASGGVSPFADESAKLNQLVGHTGITLTLLRPAGSIDVGGERIDAVSESDVIEPNTRVEILRVNGLKVIVKPVS